MRFCILGIMAILSVVTTGALVAEEAEDAAPFLEKVKAEQYSSTNRFLVEEYMYRLPQNTGYKHEIWLVLASDASKRKLLFTHERAAEVLFSEDDHWIGINNRFCSTDAGVIFFRKKNGMDFEQVDDITERSWEFFAKQTKSNAGFDHSYVEILRWTDSRTVLLCLHGHGDGHRYLEDWLCLYDVNTKTFSTDLDGHNKKHTVLEDEVPVKPK